MGRIDPAPPRPGRGPGSAAGWIVAGALAIALAVLACSNPHDPAQSGHVGPADAYRSVPWGSSEQEAAKKIHFRCIAMSELFVGKPQRSCTSTFQIGDATIEDELRFVEDRLLFVNGTSANLKDWTALRDSFVAKYGPPSGSDDSSGSITVSWDIHGTFIGLCVPFNHEMYGTKPRYWEWSREMRERQAAAAAAKANEGKKAL